MTIILRGKQTDLNKLGVKQTDLNKFGVKQTDLNKLGSILAQRGGGGSIMSVCWHPHTTTLAAVMCDDTVRIYVGGLSVAPFLKHRHQKGVTQVAWM